MKAIIYYTVMLFILSFAANAQDSTSNAKIDTVLLYQKKALDQQETIYNEVVRYKEPLENKKYGIELNPAYFLVSSSRSYLVLSGGLSFFSVDRNAEIACPIFYQSGSDKQSGGHEVTLWNQDIIYRRFLGQHQDGFYLAGGMRYTHIRGELENGISIFGISFGSSPSTIITTDKVGAMFGIGYRYFSSSGFYWGTSIVYGAYFSADERDIKEVFPDDTKTIIDFEILKFGVAF
jgi:hypothetical protein